MNTARSTCRKSVQLEASIEVKNNFEITDRNGKMMRRAGCVFVKPDGKTSMLLQRYVAPMQQAIDPIFKILTFSSWPSTATTLKCIGALR